MGDYSKFIAPERRSVPTPRHLVENGKCAFGTFDREFETLDLLGIEKPTSAPDFLNKLKLTLWEAIEVHLEEGVLLVACCDMGFFGQILHIFYDKRTKKVTSWGSKVPSSKAEVAQSLRNGATTSCTGKKLSFRCVNDFQEGKCHVQGWHEGKAGRI